VVPTKELKGLGCSITQETTMAFVQAMSAPDTCKTGVNGAAVYTEDGVGDYRVTLFSMLNRGLEASYINEYVTKVFAKNIPEMSRDMFVMAFQTRDVRGGKGEKKLFQHFFKSLWGTAPDVAREMLKLVPEYGCWRDMWELAAGIPELEGTILEITNERFLEDMRAHSAGNTGLSLLAKWLPREKATTYKGLAHKVAAKFYANERSDRMRMMRYRKDVSMLNKALKTVEINMCGGSWADIVPEAVPGRCLKIHTKAFLNEPIKKRRVAGGAGLNLDDSEEAQLRYPDNEDRMTCRAHFKEFSKDLSEGKTKAHGANVVMPHELVNKLVENRELSSDEIGINQGQWDSIREETLKCGGLGKAIAMCDFSGSMDGLPKQISLALGILISEVTHKNFRDHILTFDSEPKWHSFKGLITIKDKVETIRGSLGQGLNTDFYKACMRILEKMVASRVPVGEEPEDLIVLTDMGFNDATHHYRSVFSCSVSSPPTKDWVDQLEIIRTKFKEAGETLWGAGNGWVPPRIVIWNLRAEYKDFHAKADQEGVVQLSGWSPSMLKVLQTEGIKVATPYMGLRVTLDNARYDPVRAVWDTVRGAVGVEEST
jgi:hypothetical protein